MKLDTMVDMVLSPEGDLALSNGRLDYYTDTDTVPNAVFRRAGTPPGGYARMVRSGSQTSILNSQYESVFSTYLSSSAPDLEERLNEAFQQVAKQDGRIDIASIDVSRSSAYSNRLNLTAYYTYPNSSAPLDINEATFEI